MQEIKGRDGDKTGTGHIMYMLLLRTSQEETSRQSNLSYVFNIKLWIILINVYLQNSYNDIHYIFHKFKDNINISIPHIQ